MNELLLLDLNIHSLFQSMYMRIVTLLPEYARFISDSIIYMNCPDP